MEQTKVNNRINRLFESGAKNVLNVYFTAGYPNTKDTLPIIEYLTAAGTDLIEIGIPFSDPVADGETIQRSGQKALDQGMTLSLLFEQLESLREKVETPIILMGYVNPVIQYGVEAFCKKAKEVGIDGVILPDLPLKEYTDQYQTIFQANHLHNIFLISPQTSDERINAIDEHSSGFIYMVSSASITGAKKGISKEQINYFNRVSALILKNKLLIGFGISDQESFDTACQYADGAIIGSAFINHLNHAGVSKDSIQSFIKSIRPTL